MFTVFPLSDFESSPCESSLPELSYLFSPFKWRILIRIVSKTSLKIVAYNNLSGHHLSKGPPKPPINRDEGITII